MRKVNSREERRKAEEKTDENNGHYVIASSRPPERRLLERRTLVPKVTFFSTAESCAPISQSFIFDFDIQLCIATSQSFLTSLLNDRY